MIRSGWLPALHIKIGVAARSEGALQYTFRFSFSAEALKCTGAALWSAYGMLINSLPSHKKSFLWPIYRSKACVDRSVALSNQGLLTRLRLLSNNSAGFVSASETTMTMAESGGSCPFNDAGA